MILETEQLHVKGFSQNYAASKSQNQSASQTSHLSHEDI
jgi:hypothetical protein